MELYPSQIVISVFLFLILFFGIGFLLNMLLKTTWLPGAIIYPVVVLLIVNPETNKLVHYFTQPGIAFSELGSSIMGLKFIDYLILGAGLVGAIISGVTIKLLRQKGYRMF